MGLFLTLVLIKDKKGVAGCLGWLLCACGGVSLADASVGDFDIKMD
jgi:hypothetical protein